MRQFDRLQAHSRIQMTLASVSVLPYPGVVGGWARLASFAAAVLNLGFWVIAANQFEPKQVGVGAMGVAAAVVVALITSRGSGGSTGVEKQRTGGSPSRLLLGLYSMYVSVGAVGAVLFVGAIGLWLPGFESFGKSVWLVAIFVGAVPGWSVCALNRRVWARSKLARWQPVGLVGVPLVSAASLLILGGSSEPFVVFAAWALPMVAASVITSVFAVRSMSVKPSGKESGGPDEKARDSAEKLWHSIYVPTPQWVSNYLIGGVGALSILAVLWGTGPAAAAVWVIVGVVGYCLFQTVINLVPRTGESPDNVDDLGGSRALSEHISGTPTFFKAQAAAMAWALIPSAVVFVSAPYILELFGPLYARSGTSALRLVSLATIPGIALHKFVVRFQRMGRSSAVLVLQGLLVPFFLIGFGVAQFWGGAREMGVVWLVVITAGGAYVLGADSVWWWGPRLGTRASQRASQIRSGRAGWARRSMLRRYEPVFSSTVADVYGAPVDWKIASNSNDSYTLTVSGANGKPPACIEIAVSPWGAELLAQRKSAMERLDSIKGLASVRAMVPRLSGHHMGPGPHYLVENMADGTPGDQIAGRVEVDALVAKVVEVVDQLHQATAEQMVFDQSNLDHWLLRPLQTLQVGARISSDQISSIKAWATPGLSGLTIDSAQLHGNLQLSQARFGSSGRLTGLLGWEWSQPGPVLVDRGVLAISAIAVESGADLGPVVAGLIKDPEPFVSHRAFEGSQLDLVDPAAAIVVCWLVALMPSLRSAAAQPASPYWIARNVTPVVAAAHKQLEQSHRPG